MDGAIAYGSYNLGDGVGWGDYQKWAVTGIYGENSGLVGVSTRVWDGPQVVLRGVELIARVPSEVRADLQRLAREEGIIVGANRSGDPEVPAWGLSMRTVRSGDSVITVALLVDAEAAADPYGSKPIVQWWDVRELEPNPGAWPVRADRDRPRWEWTPLERIGPLEFGMSPQQVVAALNGEAPAARRGRYPYGEPWESIGQWYLLTDRFDRTGVTALYTYREGLPALGAVQVHGRSGPQVEFAGIPLIGMVPSVVEEALIQYCDDHGLETTSGPSGLGSEQLNMYVGATSAGDAAISEARFCAPGWYDEG
ncbi:hypothetical protein ACIQNU_42470 [Streptomyces sp. NPDC091292]|uniref:hypothetical protein n=1 Tax=Streptomyces sp. NPDC091292 TaxID=3365991 RepID=UPI00381CC8F5